MVYRAEAEDGSAYALKIVCRKIISYLRLRIFADMVPYAQIRLHDQESLDVATREAQVMVRPPCSHRSMPVNAQEHQIALL